MKKLISFVYFTQFFILATQAQSWQWAIQSAGGASDVGRGVAIDAKNNVMVVADFMGNITYGNQNLTGIPFSNCLIAKHSSNGNLIWVNHAEGVNSMGISVDSLGNNYITGNCGFAKFYGTTNSIKVTQQGNGDAFIAKYDSTGNVLWVKTWGYSVSVDMANTIKTDALGNSYIAGQCNYFNYNIGDESSNYFIAKYDTEGNILWAKTSNWQGSMAPNSLDIDTEGNCYLTGVFKDSAVFDNIILLAPTCYHCNYKNHIFIVKYDKNGNVLWAKKDGTERDEGHGISLDKKGNFYLTGRHSNPSTFGATVLTGSGQGGMFIAKYDTSGNNIWAKHTDAISGKAVKSDTCGDCFITGSIKGTVAFGTGANAVTLTSVKVNGDFFVAKYDKNGNLKYAVAPGGSNVTGNAPYAIDIDAENNCLITGEFSQTTVFGNVTLNAAYATSGFTDIFVAKMNDDFVTNLLPDALQTQAPSLNVYPNPSRGVFEINYPSSIYETSELNIFDSTGKLIYTDLCKGNYIKKIDISTRAKGIFFLIIVTDGQRVVKKIILE